MSSLQELTSKMETNSVIDYGCVKSICTLELLWGFLIQFVSPSITNQMVC